MQMYQVSLKLNKPESPRLHEILGNEAVKRAITIALAGSHDIVLVDTANSPAYDFLEAAFRIAKEFNLSFKGKMIKICMCGNYGNPMAECTCSFETLNQQANEIERMVKNRSIVIEVMAPSASEKRIGVANNEHESVIVNRILKTLQNTQVFSGALSMDAENMIDLAVKEIGIDRAKVLRIAQTIARMECRSTIDIVHILEAIRYQQCAFIRWISDFKTVEAS